MLQINSLRGRRPARATRRGDDGGRGDAGPPLQVKVDTGVLRPVPKEGRDNPAGDEAGKVIETAHFGASREPHFEPRHAETVGQLLSLTRAKFGQDLGQAAQALRIRTSYLEAIEGDRHAELPGLAYAVGFVRSYAEYLGLDGRSVVQRYKDEVQGISRQPVLTFPAPMQEAKVPTGAIILVALVLLGLAYGGWTYFSRDTAPPFVAASGSEAIRSWIYSCRRSR